MDEQTIDHITQLAQLNRQLYRALLLAKSDAEKSGFSYGPQSTIVKALHAYQSRSSSSSSPSKT
jgi:hypothetical protein